jgi:hypothetical protein
MRAATPELIQRLQPVIGNRAVQRIVRTGVTPGLMVQADRGLLQQAPIARVQGPVIKAPKIPKRLRSKAAKKKPKKKLIEKAKAAEILYDAYKGYVKKITSGKVVVLPQADFEKAWDKIYGKGDWDKNVKPVDGNLEGFAHNNVSYINKDLQSVDVVPHEMLHNNEAASWYGFAGEELNEGVTEYLTIKAVKAAKYKPTHSYPDQERVARELVKVTSEGHLLSAYFKGKTADLKKEMESKCRGNWAQFKAAMQAEKWTKAKGYLKPPKKDKKKK